VQRELARLEAAGLVTMRRTGNQKHYQPNPAALNFEELRVLRIFGLADVLRATLAPFWPQMMTDGVVARISAWPKASLPPAVSGRHSWIEDGAWPSGVQHSIENGYPRHVLSRK
jgi:hypothetical protein